MFWEYFKLGWEHIIGWGAWDHLLFIAALISVYTTRDMKKILILVTAFTIGHSITLVLAALEHVNVNREIIEFLIPLSILVTAIFNLTSKRNKDKMVYANYFLALGFGLIHGLGFAGALQSLLGRSSSLVVPVFGFNVGLEAGQIVVVAILPGICGLFMKYLHGKHRDWSIFINGGAFISSLIMVTERWPF